MLDLGGLSTSTKFSEIITLILGYKMISSHDIWQSCNHERWNYEIQEENILINGVYQIKIIKKVSVHNK